MPEVVVFDSKSYDRHYLAAAPGANRIGWRHLEIRLTAETAELARGADAVCVFVNDHVDRACLEKISALGVRLVALRCAGFNNVDLDAARSAGLVVTRVPSYSPNAVAEHAVALLLTLNRKIHRAYNRVREHNFSLVGLDGFDIQGRTIGVIGTGKIGRIVARIFRGFDAQVLAYDPVEDRDWAAGAGVEYRDCDSLLAASDIVTLHAPLTPETSHLLNRRTLARMKAGAYVVNTSRGKLIDTAALIHFLKNGHLGGVALDVYEEEEGIFFEDHSDRLIDDDQLNLLLSFPNVLVTSHQAFFTREALAEIARVTTENVLRLGSGECLPGTRLV